MSLSRMAALVGMIGMTAMLGACQSSKAAGSGGRSPGEPRLFVDDFTATAAELAGEMARHDALSRHASAGGRKPQIRFDRYSNATSVPLGRRSIESGVSEALIESELVAVLIEADRATGDEFALRTEITERRSTEAGSLATRQEFRLGLSLVDPRSGELLWTATREVVRRPRP